MTGNASTLAVGMSAANEPKSPTPMGGASVSEVLAGREFLIASRKHTLKRHRYITFWRANRAGYAWPLPWAGRYSAADANTIGDAPGSLYPDGHSYAVPLEIIERLVVSPRDGDIDGNAGPVLLNTKAHWALIEAHATLLRQASNPTAEGV